MRFLGVDAVETMRFWVSMRFLGVDFGCRCYLLRPRLAGIVLKPSRGLMPAIWAAAFLSGACRERPKMRR